MIHFHTDLDLSNMLSVAEVDVFPPHTMSKFLHSSNEAASIEPPGHGKIPQVWEHKVEWDAIF